MTTFTDPTLDEVKALLFSKEGNEASLYHDPTNNGYPTHGLGVRLDNKGDLFLSEYISKLKVQDEEKNSVDYSSNVQSYVYDSEQNKWIEELDINGEKVKKTLKEVLKSLFLQSDKKPFNKSSGIPDNAAVRLPSTKNNCEIAFKDVVYLAYLNGSSSLKIFGVKEHFSDSVWSNLSTNQRLALYSLNYQGMELIGPKLKNAIITNNRAEAWYEIRYNSHGGDSKNLAGIAERRIEESNMFSLYGTENPTKTDFCSAYIMYQKHRSQIEAYENRWSRYFSNQPNNIQSQLSSAYKYLTDTYASGNKTIAWNQIYIGDIDNNQINKKGTGNALVIAGAGNDTINAGAGNDILIGGTGSDKLTGGSGCDTYKFNSGDGYDTIIESFNEFNVIEINDYSTTFEAFSVNNDIMLRSTNGGNHIRIKGNSNFEIRFSDTTTTLSAMLEEQEELPDDTYAPESPFSGGLFTPGSGTKYIYLPDNFNGGLDLSELGSDVEIYGITDDTVILLPEGTEPEPDGGSEPGSGSGMSDLIGPEGKRIKLTPAPGFGGGTGKYIPRNGNLRIPDGNGGWKPFLPEGQQDLRPEAKANLKEEKTSAEEIRSPLAIDLDGDGIETISVDNGVYFDHDGNGFAEKTGWIGSDDALLVRDINENGQIDNGSELFGNQTILSNGEKAANGFEALADLDSNHDGVFDGDDEAFGEIKVWQDFNQNGVVRFYSKTGYMSVQSMKKHHRPLKSVQFQTLGRAIYIPSSFAKHNHYII